MRDGIRNFKECHAQLEESALKQVFFLLREITLGLVFENAKRVDGLARADDVGLRVLACMRPSCSMAVT